MSESPELAPSNVLNEVACENSHHALPTSATFLSYSPLFPKIQSPFIEALMHERVN